MAETLDDDDVAFIFVLFLFLGSGGLALLGSLFAPVRGWMVEHSILVQGDQVIIPIVAGVGLGWPQILVLGGILLAALIGAVALKRRSARHI